MQFMDFVAFRGIGPVLTLNIGGIANCQLADMDRRRMMAFDTGPGNVMLDHSARVLLGKPYDADGAAAARGKVDEKLLSRLLEHDFFRRRPPRSAWRLDFGSSFAGKHIAENRNLTPADLLATFTEFTAMSVSHSIRDHIPILGEISTLIASGGASGTRCSWSACARISLPACDSRSQMSSGIPAQGLLVGLGLFE
jgi:anhydro-N-acetylmuramic acid kinase